MIDILDSYIPFERKSFSAGISLGNTPLPIRTGHRNLLMSSEEYPVRPLGEIGECRVRSMEVWNGEWKLGKEREK